MTHLLKLTTLFLLITVFSCKQNNELTEYKYADKPQVINCAGADNKLLNEALYSFEEDLLGQFGQKNSADTFMYNQFMLFTNGNRVPYNTMVSDHSKKVLNALKTAGILKNGTLDYKGNIINCISQNLTQTNLKTTFDALMTTNSMNKRIFGPALQANTQPMAEDKYASLLVALDYYYGNMDANMSNSGAQNKANDPHAGHNH